jgi:hypothetical protein
MVGRAEKQVNRRYKGVANHQFPTTRTDQASSLSRWRLGFCAASSTVYYGQLRLRIIGGSVSVARILLIAVVALGYATVSVAQNSAPSPVRQDTEHVRLSTPIVKAWREIPVGSPIYALDDAAGAKDWLERALIQHIEFQTGKWYIWMETGYSVFRIYPYLSKGSPQPSVFQGIVLKVKGTLSVEDLLAAIRNRTPTIKIDEYDLFGADGVSIQRYSRAHDGDGLRL